MKLGPGAGAEAAVTGFFSRHAGVEVAGSWLRQTLKTTLTDDVEGAEDVAASQPLDRLSVEGALIVMVRQGRRAGVFLRAGGGWMQEVLDGSTLAKAGTTATFGIGVKYWWGNRPAGRGTQVGLRLDARLLARSGGVSLGTRRYELGPTGMAGLVFGF